MSEIDKKATSPLIDTSSGASASTGSHLSPHQSAQQQHSRSTQHIDFLTGSGNQSQQQAQQQDLFMFAEEQRQPATQGSKLGANDIMSLYNNTPVQSQQYSAYTGNPVSHY